MSLLRTLTRFASRPAWPDCIPHQHHDPWIVLPLQAFSTQLSSVVHTADTPHAKEYTAIVQVKRLLVILHVRNSLLGPTLKTSS